jgi:hypothetical protein
MKAPLFESDTDFDKRVAAASSSASSPISIAAAVAAATHSVDRQIITGRKELDPLGNNTISTNSSG